MALSFTFYGLGTVQQYIKGLPQRMNQDTLRTLNTWGKTFMILGKALSPEDRLRQIDNRRRPPGERFKLQWQYDLTATPTEAVLRIGNVDPRMQWIVFPTKSRDIPTGGAVAQIAKGYQMRFYFYTGQMMKRWQIQGGAARHGTFGNLVHERMVYKFNFPAAATAFGVLLVRP